ncbi:hypothetical protein [Halobacillus sp. Marseille-Q1614]|uniref:hypothetical protein n=1 Tax=Halobacillus sp. Marseille-Q1614 TaxID=2709134 RepID=UPI00156E9BA8|nr:hypothetical protein [Halobacillus sp. Marseille-Q1614]
MGSVRVEELIEFVSETVQVCIHGWEGEDRAPWADKYIAKVERCPDATHVRVYFDDFYFLAVPLNSEVERAAGEWSAFDQRTGLSYVIRYKEKENV